MKTAIFNTDFWKDDKVFSLNSDTRLLYLCLITNPERTTTPAYKCSDRLVSAYTGYTKELLVICKKQLEKKGLIFFVDDYIVIGNSAYIKPTKGKLTEELYKKEFDKLPIKIKDFISNLLLSHSCATPEYIDKDINKDIDKDIDKDNSFDIFYENSIDESNILDQQDDTKKVVVGATFRLEGYFIGKEDIKVVQSVGRTKVTIQENSFFGETIDSVLGL